MEKIDRGALGRERESLVNGGNAHAVKGGFFAVDEIADFGLVGFDEPIDIYGAGCAFDDGAHGRSEGEALRFGGAVNFSDD